MQGFYQVRFLAIQGLCLIHSQTLHRFLHILLPGVYPPLDLVPALKYLPERWAPWLAACRRSRSETAAFRLEHSSAAAGRAEKHGDDIPAEGESFMSSVSKMRLSQEEYDAYS